MYINSAYNHRILGQDGKICIRSDTGDLEEQHQVGGKIRIIGYVEAPDKIGQFPSKQPSSNGPDVQNLKVVKQDAAYLYWTPKTVTLKVKHMPSSYY